MSQGVAIEMGYDAARADSGSRGIGTRIGDGGIAGVAVVVDEGSGDMGVNLSNGLKNGVTEGVVGFDRERVEGDANSRHWIGARGPTIMHGVVGVGGPLSDSSVSDARRKGINDGRGGVNFALEGGVARTEVRRGSSVTVTDD